jgi:transposase
MASGRFEGLTDAQWNVLQRFFEPEWNYVGPKGGGRPKSFRKTLNGILWILITGAKWDDIPRNDNFLSPSTSNMWFGRWSKDGTLAKIHDEMIVFADLHNKINWEKAFADGSFSPRTGWGRRRGCRVRT